MNLHKFVIEVNCLTHFFNNEEIEEEIWCLMQSLNDNNVSEIESDPCLLVSVRRASERKKLKANCTHSKIHRFLKSLSWITFIIMNDLENDFSKTLDDVLEKLQKGNLVIEPDLEIVEKCIETRRRVEEMEKIFNNVTSDLSRATSI
jgi:hypothetical protein